MIWLGNWIDQTLLKLSKRSTAPLSESRLWMLALSAMYIADNGGSHLWCPPHSWWTRQQAWDMLRHFWSIQGRTHKERNTRALQTLTWLKDKGHRTEATSENSLDLLAWDYGRLIYVARMCVHAGFLEEKDAWNWIIPAAHTLQNSYTSWSNYANHFMRGRLWWASEEDIRLRKVIEHLLIDLNSPWVRLKWKTHLEIIEIIPNHNR